MESESGKEVNAVSKLSVGRYLKLETNSEIQTCNQMAYWGRFSKGVTEAGLENRKS